MANNQQTPREQPSRNEPQRRSEQTEREQQQRREPFREGERQNVRQPEGQQNLPRSAPSSR